MKTAIITFTDPLRLDQSGVSYEIAFGAGVDGRDGKSATIQIGTVATGAPGTPAQVTNAGTENAAIFDFVIPQGADGRDGTNGIDGKDGEPGKDGVNGEPGKSATIAIGTVTTGDPGSQAAVTNSGTENAAIFNFVIPQGLAGQNGTNGQDGAKGDDGAPGQSATITVGNVTTGEPGTNASVTNSGTSSAAVFDFIIPRGATGQNGADGAPGTPGAKGEDGATPEIGSNENWWINGVDTGKPSRGAVGPQGAKGDTGETGPQGPIGPTGPEGPQGPAGTNGTNGADGKSAYQSAQDGGFTGTEAEFNQQLASIGNINAVLDEINGEVI